MSTSFVRIVTPLALFAILALQAVWLHNTYSFYKEELKTKIEQSFSESVQKEVFVRKARNQKNIPSGSIINDADPTDGMLAVARGFNTFLTYGINKPVGLTVLDSIFQDEMDGSSAELRYLLIHVDSLENVKEVLSRGMSMDNISENDLYYKNSLPILVHNDVESIKIFVDSPDKVIFRNMTLLLIASGLIILIVAYCFVWQIKTILRQNKIAMLRQDFTYAMIHEMKTPITTIVMGTEALKSGKLDSKQEVKQQYLDILTQESNHLLELTNRILVIAKLEQKKIRLVKEKLLLSEFIVSIIDKYKVEANKTVNFETVLNDIEYIYIDAEFFRESIGNLIDNSIKYSADTVNISICFFLENQNLKIVVRDDGFGISLKDQKNIFDKFERGSKYLDVVSGFGLGLNYVYQVVEAHGGNLSVNSVEGVYSEFVINIPNQNG